MVSRFGEDEILGEELITRTEIEPDLILLSQRINASYLVIPANCKCNWGIKIYSRPGPNEPHTIH